MRNSKQLYDFTQHIPERWTVLDLLWLSWLHWGDVVELVDGVQGVELDEDWLDEYIPEDKMTGALMNMGDLCPLCRAFGFYATRFIVCEECPLLLGGVSHCGSEYHPYDTWGEDDSNPHKARAVRDLIAQRAMDLYEMDGREKG